MQLKVLQIETPVFDLLFDKSSSCFLLVNWMRYMYLTVSLLWLVYTPDFQALMEIVCSRLKYRELFELVWNVITDCYAGFALLLRCCHIVYSHSGGKTKCWFK